MTSQDEPPDYERLEGSLLPFAYGRSYGDSCLNDGGNLLDMAGLDQIIHFDAEAGIICCEAGTTLATILDLIVPAGWFLPVTPGTRYISVGGAIANDVHGKNHHVAGTFGCHVTRFELLRSDGSQHICSPTQNVDFFRATIGGLGLTGIITWAEFRLKKIKSPLINMETIRFGSFEEFFEISAQTDEARYEYTVSWTDCSAEGKQLGRGLFNRGDFVDEEYTGKVKSSPRFEITVPFELPSFVANRYSFKIFNTLYYHRQIPKISKRKVSFIPFFYPMDGLLKWYRVYGKAGFLEYQFVMNYPDGDLEPVKEIYRRIARSGLGSPLAVFKVFGSVQSPGMLSFPRPGLTLGLDIPYKGERTLKLLNELDEIVFANGGAIYPAKDARMSPENFRKSFPNWEEFAKYKDPAFSSSFWRRVTDG